VEKATESSSDQSPTTRKRVIKTPMELFGSTREIKPIWPNKLFLGHEGLQAEGRYLMFAHQLYERVWAHFKFEYFYFPVFIKTSEEEVDGEMCDIGYHQYFCAYIPVPWGWGVGNEGRSGPEGLAKWVTDLLEVEHISFLPPTEEGSAWVKIAEGLKPSENFWSDPVQVKIENGELVFRACAKVGDDEQNLWEPFHGE
jgi:hypothetical protein